MKPQPAPTARSRLPAHVWVRHDGEWRPGLLVNWERKPRPLVGEHRPGRRERAAAHGRPGAAPEAGGDLAAADELAMARRQVLGPGRLRPAGPRIRAAAAAGPPALAAPKQNPLSG